MQLFRKLVFRRLLFQVAAVAILIPPGTNSLLGPRVESLLLGDNFSNEILYMTCCSNKK